MQVLGFLVLIGAMLSAVRMYRLHKRPWTDRRYCTGYSYCPNRICTLTDRFAKFRRIAGRLEVNPESNFKSAPVTARASLTGFTTDDRSAYCSTPRRAHPRQRSKDPGIGQEC